MTYAKLSAISNDQIKREGLQVRIPSETERRQRIENEIANMPADAERARVPWQDNPNYTRPVINLPLEYVVLNPNSHRIKSQLEDHPDRTRILADPFSEDSQKEVADLLRGINGFADLKASLRVDGQQEEGVITATGVLINANTRAVAMRDLDPQGYIRVAVLAPSPDPKDLAKLELRLQLRKDYKQDYSFTNLLLFIEDLKRDFRYSDDDVARALGTLADPKAAKKQVQQLTRVLAMIRGLQARSGQTIKVTFFDDATIALTELDERYEKLRRTDLAGAEQMREARFAAILAGGDYRDIRKLTPESSADFIDALSDTIVGKDIRDVLTPSPDAVDHSVRPMRSAEAIDDLDLLGGGRPPTAKPSFSPLVTLIAQSQRSDTVALPSADGDREIDRGLFFHAIRTAVETTAEVVKQKDASSKRLTSPVDLLDEARGHAERALELYRVVATNPDFQTEVLREAAQKLETMAQAILAEIAKND